jgi:hypothetical protein
MNNIIIQHSATPKAFTFPKDRIIKISRCIIELLQGQLKVLLHQLGCAITFSIRPHRAIPCDTTKYTNILVHLLTFREQDRRFLILGSSLEL